MKFPFYRQPDAKDCGPTCLRIIAKYYKKDISLQTIRNLSETTREGSSLFGLSASYSFSSFYTNSNRNPFSNQINDNKSHYVGILLNFPIFNKLQTQKSIEQSKIELERSQLKTHQLKQEYYNLMSDLYLKTNNSLDKWEASEKNLKDYQLSFEKIEDKFKFGLITIYEYLNSKNNLLQIETSNLIDKYSFYLNSNMLNYYTK